MKPLPRPFQGVAGPVLILGLLLLGLIQILQPYYFQKPDNLNQLFPVWTECGRNWLRGENPFVSQYLYGGNYPLYKDVTFLSCFHPLVILISLLANTPLRFALIDIFAGFQILASCLALAVLLITLKKRGFIQILPWQTVALSLSYGFCGYNLIVGSAWIFYIANQVALPLYFTAFLMPNRLRGAALIAVAGAHAFLSGVPSSYLFTAAVCTLAAAVQSLSDRRIETLLRWILGQAGTALLLSPILYFAINGFLESGRNDNTPFIPGYLLDVPWGTLVLGWFLAGIGPLLGPEFSPALMSVALAYAIFSAAVSWWLLPCLFSRRNRACLSWENAVLAALLVTACLVIRPAWVTSILERLPLFRSTRWPFREMFILVFFLHLLIALRLQNISGKLSARLFIPGAVLLAATLIFFQPMAYTYHALDRHLLFSGRAERYWENLKSLSPGKILLLPVHPTQPALLSPNIPFTLLGAYNYPAFFEVKSATGYSSTPVAASLHLREKFPYTPGYVYDVDLPDFTKGLANPLTIQLLSLHPVQVLLRNDSFRQTITLDLPDFEAAAEK